jgi:signal peptidase I
VYVSTTFQPEPILKFYRIAAGSSTLRTLSEQYLVLDNLTYHFTDPERGDLIILEHPKNHKDMAKRVVGMPGDRIEIRDKRVWINDRYFHEDYVRYSDLIVYSADVGPRDNLPAVQIPPDAYFVLGDNRDEGVDSRVYGPVGRSSIRAKGRIVSWSFDLR